MPVRQRTLRPDQTLPQTDVQVSKVSASKESLVQENSGDQVRIQHDKPQAEDRYGNRGAFDLAFVIGASLVLWGVILALVFAAWILVAK